jgi:truncated hemoglobin YjbI
MISDGEIYAQIGEEGFERLVRAFYAQVPGDDVLGPMYPKDDLIGAAIRACACGTCRSSSISTRAIAGCS